MDEKKEKDFNEWLETISFVNSNGELILPTLEDDASEDPEDDREGEQQWLNVLVEKPALVEKEKARDTAKVKGRQGGRRSRL